MISVVIPLYNKEQSIAATLQSVLAQTYTDFEVIVVDDGSTDNSLKVVREYASSLPCYQGRDGGRPLIRVIHKENGGVSSARNRGIEESQGEYIAFLDADDLWAPNYLTTLAALITDFPNAGLYSLGYVEMRGNQSLISVRNDIPFQKGWVNHPWQMLKGLWTGSVAASRERLLKLGMFDTRMTHGEDLDMWWRLILDGGLVEDNACCAFYRVDAENRAMDKVIPLEKHIPYFIDKFAEARAENAEFRRFFDKQMVYRLYPYLFDRRYCAEAQEIARKLDYSQLKRSMYFRMRYPHIYRMYRSLLSIIK